MIVISFIVALAVLVAALQLTVIASELSSEADTSGDLVKVAEVIRDGESLTLTVPYRTGGTFTYVKFTPETDGTYWLRSESDTDPRVELYSSELEYITYADDNNGMNFSLVYDYVAGETYYFAICDKYVEATHEYAADGECVCGYFKHEHVYDAYDCDHMCHKDGVVYAIIWGVFERIYDYLGMETVCDCGEVH